VNVKSAPATPLQPDTDYAYAITVTDGAGSTSTASSVFSTSLLEGASSSLSGADWMSPPAAQGSPTALRLFRCPFSLPFRPTRARLYVATGNYFKASLNGERVSRHELGSFTTFQQRVLYATVNVTEALRVGPNVLGISAGNGWYSQSSIAAGPVTLKLLLTADGPDGQSVTLPATAGAGGAMGCMAGPSPVVADDIYIGETYDATLEQPGWDTVAFQPGSTWMAPATSDGGVVGAAALSAWRLPITIDESFTPMSVSEPADGVFVADFGQNMAGIVTLQVPSDAEPGTVITLSHSEILYPNGSVHDVYRNAPMKAVYTVREGGAAYTVQFSYMGFRYVQIEGFPGTPSRSSLTAHFVHSAVARTGSFASSNDVLNSVVDVTRYASLSNLMDIPTDCPQRERRGWLGDAQLSTEVVLYNFDASLLYPKFIRDIADSQTFLAHEGALPDCVPWYHHGGLPADPAWGVAGALIPRWVSEYLDDDALVADAYNMTSQYVDSEVRRAETGILDSSRYGDWCSVAEGLDTRCQHPSAVVSTYYLIQALDTAAGFASRLGRSADAARYTSLAASSRKAFAASFYHPGNASVGDGTQVHLLAGLASGALDQSQADAVGKTLVRRFTNDSTFPLHPSGGIVYTKLLWPALDALQRSDLGLTAMLAGPSKPGFVQMLNQTATTLWESWNMDQFEGSASRNHIMFGGASGLWPFTTVAGIKRVGRSWSALRLEPAVTAVSDRVKWASGSIDSPVGLIAASWDTAQTQGPGKTCVEGVPENTEVTFKCLAAGGAAPGPNNKFRSVAFASFGTPTGSCAQGFAVDPTCNANVTVPIVEALCVGKSECRVNASRFTFGDPCFKVHKHFDAKLVGECADVQVGLKATVPPNVNAAVVVPVSGAPASADISESGTIVWSQGAFQPGAPGVTGAKAVPGGVEFVVGSGSFDFAVSGVSSN